MATTQQHAQFPSLASFDEQRWIIHIRGSLEEDEVDRHVHVKVSIFSVPKPLLACKPEAFIPHLFAVGPYHHWKPQLYEMEHYKIATARRVYKKLHGITIDELVQKFMVYEHTIRSHYHRYLELTDETLAWMMAIDASFLLQFLRCFSVDKLPSMSHMVESAKFEQSYNVILRDVTMLENQIPLLMVREILHHQSSSMAVADEELANMLLGFVKEASPFKAPNKLDHIKVIEQPHLLALLYRMILPKPKKETLNEDIKEENENEKDGELSKIMKLFYSVYRSVPAETIANIKKRFFVRPLKVLIKLPWKVISSIPVISALKGPIESLFSIHDEEKAKDEDSVSANKSPLLEEIAIPSVSELLRAGVKFCATNGDLTTLRFDVKTTTLHLPRVTLDANTEVVLRNLVAYEATVETGPLVFARYTELINGIIDAGEDVKLLRERGIIVNRLKSDEEVADIWNGMCKSVRLTKVPQMDKAIEDVNKFYNSRWSVRTGKFMKTYVLGSWQCLVFLGAIFLLLLTCVQAFCSVYRCNARWSGIVTDGAGH